MALFLLVIYTYLVCGVVFYGKKRKTYNHFRYSISELGELGSEYEKHVSYFIFLPVGLGCLIVSFARYDSNYPAAFLSGAIGFSYFLSAFFPCDPETPLLGTWKNTMHNIIGGVCYAATAYQLNELMDSKAAWFIDVTFKLLCAFLLIFIVGFPKSIIGLAQRLAEASIFLSTALLLFGVSFT
jgi:hypothetical protein